MAELQPVSSGLMKERKNSAVVVHVVTSLRPGGLERLVVDWTLERNARFPDSTFVACLDEQGEWGSVLGRHVVTIGADRACFPWDRPAAARVGTWAESIAGDRPVILHAHNIAAWQYAVLAARGRRLGVVYTQHGPNPHCRTWKDRLRCRWLATRSAAIVAVGRTVAEAMVRHQAIPRDRIRVIPNGIVFRAARSRTRPWPDDVFALGFVGRLSPEKRVDRLIGAFADLAHRPCPQPGRVGWGLWIVGDGPQRTELERKAACLGTAIRNRVVFAGRRDDIPECLAGMDLFLLPSEVEGCSVALIEAMAAGVPAMASMAGDNEDLLEHGQSGFLLDADEKKWPVQILAFCADRQRMMEMSARARERASRFYSAHRVLAEYENVYAGS